MPRYAAIDVGSNSIRLLVADVDNRGRMRTLSADRQVVRLGTGVFRGGRVTDAAIDLACRVLRRMAEEMREFRVTEARAVATSAIRDATNQVQFVARASAVMGVPLEVISGIEEARFVQLGVQARWPQPRGRTLVVDVGGGSAQLILSDRGRFVEAFSRPLGAVRLTEQFVKSDPPSDAEKERLLQHIRREVAGPLRRFAKSTIARCIATSSTGAAVVCAVNDVRRTRRDEADRLAASARQVQGLLDNVSRLDLEGRSQITGIGPRRAEIIVAGVAVLHEILAKTGLPRFYYSTAGVRDGLLAAIAAEHGTPVVAGLD